MQLTKAFAATPESLTGSQRASAYILRHINHVLLSAADEPASKAAIDKET